MVRYKDLNAPVGEQIAGMLRDLRVMAQSSKTVPAGVKDLGAAGDVVWDDQGAESGRRSVRDVASLVDAAAERAGEVAERLTIVEGDVSSAADRLHTVETVTIPQAVASGNMIPDGSTMQLDSQWSPLALDTQDVPPGVSASRRTKPGQGAVSLGSQVFPVEPGREYVAEVWVKADKPGSKLSVEMRDDKGGHAGKGALTEPESVNTGVYWLLNGREVPTEWTRLCGTWTPNEGVKSVCFGLFYFNHTKGSVKDATVWIAGLSMRPKVGSVLIEDGAVTTPKLTVTSDMAAKLVSALTIEAKKIIVTGESLAGVHLSERGLIATDGENTLELNGKGLGLYTQGPDGLEEQVYLGPSGENLLTIGTSTIAKGAISAEQGAFDTLTVGGEDITTLVTGGPRGLIAWGKSEQLGQWDGTGKEIWRLQVDAVLYPGRMYRVTSSSHYVQTRSKLPNSVTEWLRCKDITDGVNVTSSSPQLASIIHQIPQAGAYTVPSMTAIIDGTAINAAEDGTKFQFVVSSATSSDVRYSASLVTPWTLTVEDIGPTVEAAGSSWVHTGTPTGGSADTSVTKPPAATRVYKSTWTPSYGGDISSGQVIQGTYPGVGERWGGWVMPSAMRSEMRAAKSIAKVEVYLYAEHWYYGAGGTAVIRPNNGTYKGTVFGNNNVTSGRWPRKAGRWVTIPSSWYPHIMSGTYKGFSVKQSSSSLEQYGRFNATATRFRVTYTK